MITSALLKLRVSLLLKNEKPVRDSYGNARWDFEPEHRLVWTDAARVTHLCKVPPAPIPDQYEPATLCQTPINSLHMHLADYHELGGTNCPDCLREDAGRAASVRAASPRLSKPVALSYLACSFLLGGLVIGLYEYYASSSSPEEPTAQAPIIYPVIHDHEPAGEVGDEF